MEPLSPEQVFRLRRNLSDAGCDEALIARFLELEQTRCRSEQYRMLAHQKAALLQTLHCVAYQIDCLDHLLYRMHQQDTAADSKGGFWL